MSASPPRPAPIARYNATAITLHWVVAALILVVIVLGLAGANVAEDHARPFVDAHKSVGITLFGLIVLRLLWRLAHRPPPMPRTYGRAEQIGAHLAHGSLYAVMLILPLTGYIHDSAWKLAASHPIRLYGLIPFPRIGAIQALDAATRDRVHDAVYAVHVYAGYVLYALLALHLLGVVKHHVVDHEAELQRMLPATGARPGGER